MKTANGVQVTLTTATAYILGNILKEWIAERTPVSKYVEHEYAHMSDGFREFKEKAITERMVRVHMVLDQLGED